MPEFGEAYAPIDSLMYDRMRRIQETYRHVVSRAVEAADTEARVVTEEMTIHTGLTMRSFLRVAYWYCARIFQRSIGPVECRIHIHNRVL